VFAGELRIGDIVLTNSDPDRLFVAKFNRDGSALWVVQTTERRSRLPESIGTDSSGNVYVAGSWQGSDLSDPSPYYGMLSNFLRKYDPDGNLLWERRSLRTIYTLGQSVWTVVDSSGNTIMLGGYNAKYPFGDTNPTSSDYIPKGFIAKYDSNGDVAWLKHDIEPTNAIVLGMALIRSGAFWLAGYHYVTTTNARAFLALYDNNGGVIKSLEGSGDADTYFYRVAADEVGNAYVTGRFDRGLTIGYTNIVGPVGHIVAKFDREGDLLWVYQVTNAPFLTAIAVDKAANVYVGGNAYGYSEYPYLLLKLNSTGVPLQFVPLQDSGLLSWSALADGFALESTEDVRQPTWTAIPTNMVVANAVSNTVVMPRNLPQQFFRLRRP
jgi:hypothetical protein